MRAGPIFALLLKWIAIPIALLCVGFYFIGPSIGKSDVAQNLSTAPPSDQSNNDKPKVTHYGEPKVEIISVERGGSFRPASGDYSSDYSARSSRSDFSSSGDQPKPKKHKKRHRREPSGPPPDIPFDLGPPPGDTGGGPGGPPGGDGGGPGGPG